MLCCVTKTGKLKFSREIKKPQTLLFLTLNFRRVLYGVCFLLGISPSSEF